jgi:hypothetical protein
MSRYGDDARSPSPAGGEIVKKTQCHICSFDEGHFVCSQAPVIESLNKALADLATERDRFGKREIELMRELEKYKSIAKELSEAVQVAIDRLEAYGMTTDHLKLILSKTNDL